MWKQGSYDPNKRSKELLKTSTSRGTRKPVNFSGSDGRVFNRSGTNKTAKSSGNKLDGIEQNARQEAVRRRMERMKKMKKKRAL